MINYRILLLLISIALPISINAQVVHELLSRLKVEYENQNYYKVLNICSTIEEVCEEDPVSECWFTNVMKNVYRFKGLSEFELYKQELDPKRLQNSIISLEISYELYKDAEILYTCGYLLAVRSILENDRNNLIGLVKAWKGILEIYGRDNWSVSKELVDKIKDYITITEKFILSKPSINYSGTFAKFMIFLACELAEKSQSYSDNEIFFNKIKIKYKNKIF